jgi:putative membrane protein
MPGAALNRLIAVTIAATALSAMRPHDYATWFFELVLGGLVVIVLYAVRRSFLFSAFVCYVYALHYVILALGAHYTYAEMPLFNWIRDAFGLSRNHFDRVGHFMQGVTPALLAKELLVRKERMKSATLTIVLAVSVSVAFSGLYEVFEWLWVALFYPGRGPEWLGMQGDPWDAQADMLMAFLGGITAMLAGPLHARSMAQAETLRS